MRLVARILLVAACAAVPAVVALIGCAVDSKDYPGLDNHLPNGDFGAPVPAGGAGSGSSSASSGSSSSGGPMVDLCACAVAFLSPDGGVCGGCGNAQVTGSGSCTAESTACMGDNACKQAYQNCIPSCSGTADVGGCVSACLLSSPAYQALATCQCNACETQCQTQTPLACDVGGGGGGDGGTGDGGMGDGGMGDAGMGDAGTGDAGDGG